MDVKKLKEYYYYNKLINKLSNMIIIINKLLLEDRLSEAEPLIDMAHSLSNGLIKNSRRINKVLRNKMLITVSNLNELTEKCNNNYNNYNIYIKRIVRRKV